MGRPLVNDAWDFENDEQKKRKMLYGDKQGQREMQNETGDSRARSARDKRGAQEGEGKLRTWPFVLELGHLSQGTEGKPTFYTNLEHRDCAWS